MERLLTRHTPKHTTVQSVIVALPRQERRIPVIRTPLMGGLHPLTQQVEATVHSQSQETGIIMPLSQGLREYSTVQLQL